MTLATEIMRARYMIRAMDIGSNAVNIVKEFFDTPLGIVDAVNTYQLYEWTLTDLDRALDEMEKVR